TRMVVESAVDTDIFIRAHPRDPRLLCQTAPRVLQGLGVLCIVTLCRPFRAPNRTLRANPGRRFAAVAAPLCPCMLNITDGDAEIQPAVEKAAQRSGAAFSTAAGDRPTTLRRSRRRSPARSSSAFGFSPNSRQSRIRTSRASSHLQGRDILKGLSNISGSDVSRDSLVVASLPEGTIRTVAHTSEGGRVLIAQLPKPGDCVVVIEATGGYERPLVPEL